MVSVALVLPIGNLRFAARSGSGKGSLACRLLDRTGSCHCHCLPRPAVLAISAVWGSAASAGEIALTFDDMPGIDLPNPAYVAKVNRALLAGLRRHGYTATAFVNAGKYAELHDQRQRAFLRTWLAAGMDLGNHTYSHESLNDLGPAAFMADVIRGEPILRRALGRQHRSLRWFRFPDLETGADPAPNSWSPDSLRRATIAPHP